MKPKDNKQVQELLERGKSAFRREVLPNAEKAQMTTGVLLLENKTQVYCMGGASPVDTVRVALDLAELSQQLITTVAKGAENSGLSGEDTINQIMQMLKQQNRTSHITADETKTLDLRTGNLNDI